MTSSAFPEACSNLCIGEKAASYNDAQACRQKQMTTSQSLSILPFYWYYTNPASDQTILTLKQCSTVTFAVGANNASQIQPVPPFTLQVFPSSGLPSVLDAGIDGTAARWKVNYQVGTQLLLTFVDSQGSTGGTSALITVIQGSSSCFDTDTASLGLSLDYTPLNPNTCQSVSLTPSGGVAPYTISMCVPLNSAELLLI